MRLSSRMSDRGAALIEAAMVLPVLLLLTFGIWTTARAWNVENTMEHAAREAARYGATIDPWDGMASPNAIRAVADAALSSSAINTGDISGCIELVADTASPSCSAHVNNTATDQVFVELTYPSYTLEFLFFSMSITLEATAISRFETS